MSDYPQAELPPPPPPPTPGFQHADCPNEPEACRIRIVAARSPSASVVVYDGWGRAVTTVALAPAVHATDMACVVCGAEWTVSQVIDPTTGPTITKTTKTPPGVAAAREA